MSIGIKCRVRPANDVGRYVVRKAIVGTAKANTGYIDMKNRNLTIEQMSKANKILQKLVDGVTKRQTGKGGINAFEAYDLIDKIYEIIHQENNNE